VVIANDVKDIICEHLNIEKITIDNNARLTALGADSLDIIELIYLFEDKYDIYIDNPENPDMTINEIV